MPAMTAITSSSRAFAAIFWGGLTCGILDLASALVAYGARGAKLIRIPQSIASGLLGPDAYKGGAGTAILGVALHFFIAFGAATVYYIASRSMGLLRDRPVICGFLYGEMVYLFMNFVVLPLAGLHRPPLSIASLVTGPVGHLFFVGLPIALAVHHYSK